MARLLLDLSQSLGLAEAAGLPEGVSVDNRPDGAQVVAPLPADDLPALVALTAALARALPEASISVEPDGGAASAGGDQAADARATALVAPAPAAPAPAPVASTPAAPTPAAPTPAAPTPPAPTSAAPDAWELIAQGRFDEALAALMGTALDSRGRDIVRELAASTDPAEVALSCRIAGATDWKSFVSPMRRLLDHADTRVRVAAIEAIGQLGGPAMTWQLEKRGQDPSPDVRAAVVAAIAAIEGRQA